ncbi:MAG TPA: hypothetical protein VJ986_04910 [Gaiellaceae bacterium]|nr:hypothetical protein [Gaiellaceae bacterium]
MATVLIADSDERTRRVAGALVEALGHRVVYELGRGHVDLVVVEPVCKEALALATSACNARRSVPIICVSSGRRTIAGPTLRPLARLEKPLPVGPFVRALTRALKPPPPRFAA